MMRVRQYEDNDEAEWLRMRQVLWPGAAGPEQALADARAWLSREATAVFVAEVDCRLCGFVEVGERAYADGYDTSPVVFLEGWYVDPEWRGRGVGRRLVEAAEAWARQHGYCEIASDALLQETASQRAHEALGFEEVERAVRYRKDL